jgi:hypothetical protein
MTLTSLLPTLRDSIPSPFDAVAWPHGAHPTLDDVVVRGISLLRYEDLCGTPCVLSGPAVVPLSGGAASATDATTAIVARIVAADAASVRLDASFAHLAPLWREARLIGRVSHAYDEPFAVYGAHATASSGVVRIPGDPRVGDLIAIPCPGAVTLGDLRANGR